MLQSNRVLPLNAWLPRGATVMVVGPAAVDLASLWYALRMSYSSR